MSESVLLYFSVRPFSLAAAVAGTYRRGRGVSVKLRSLTVRLFNHIRFGPFRIDLCCSRLCYERGIWQGWALTMASEGEDGMNDHLFGFTSSPHASDGSWKDASTSYRRRVPHSDWDSSKSTVTAANPSLFHFYTFQGPVFPSIWNPVLLKLWKLSFKYSESTTAAERTGAEHLYSLPQLPKESHIKNKSWYRKTGRNVISIFNNNSKGITSWFIRC